MFLAEAERMTYEAFFQRFITFSHALAENTQMYLDDIYISENFSLYEHFHILHLVYNLFGMFSSSLSNLASF